MKNKMINEVNVAGWVFNHNLNERTSKKGQVYIGGNINVATTKDGTETVPVSFTYVTPTYKSGKENPNYTTLKNIIESNATVESVGVDNATMVRISGDISVNDFVNNNDEMISAKQVRGGFIHVINSEAQLPDESRRSSFKADFLCNKTSVREMDDQDVMTLSGYVFNFRNDFIPVSFDVRSQAGIDYFEGLDISNKEPYFGNIWGAIKNTTIQRETKTESAFGEPEVTFTNFSRRSWDIIGAASEPYEFGDEDTITTADIKKGITARETQLEQVRQRHNEYLQSRNGGNAFTSAPAPRSAKVEVGPDDDDYEF